MRFGFNDKWEKYDSVLHLGLHCAETDDTTLLKKVLFDGSATIKEAQIEEIYFIIKFQSIPSYTEEKIHLH